MKLISKRVWLRLSLLLFLAGMIVWRDVIYSYAVPGVEPGPVVATTSPAPPAFISLPLVAQGSLDAHPLKLEGQCATVRLRGHPESFSVDQAVSFLRENGACYQGRVQLRVGLVWVETPEAFWSYHKGAFHLYHFLEFLVVAYTELHRLAASCSASHRAVATGPPPTLAQGSLSIQVPWIYNPHMIRSEFCGVARGINCVIIDLALQAALPSSEQESLTRLYGLESNDPLTREETPALRGEHRQRSWITNLTDEQHAQNYQAMVDTADAVLLLHRRSCLDRTIHKMWGHHIDHFPYQAWHYDIWHGLGLNATVLLSDNHTTTTTTTTTTQDTTTHHLPDEKAKIVVGYIDRQNASRPMPKFFHDYLVAYLSLHPRIHFVHLHMEQYSPLEQIRVAASCQVLVGAHGNGLSHALWMRPHSFLVELFWDFAFAFDYATTAQLMHHRYLVLMNGEPIDAARVQQRDKLLRQIPKKEGLNDDEVFSERIEKGKKALEEFLEEAVHAHLG